MGCSIGFSSCSCSSEKVVEKIVYRDRPLPNPNPKNFEIKRLYEIGPFVVVWVRYPDCTNYEGNKIMIYEAKEGDIRSLKTLDPHFCENHLSPIARFEPTERGWHWALSFAGRC